MSTVERKKTLIFASSFTILGLLFLSASTDRSKSVTATPPGPSSTPVVSETAAPLATQSIPTELPATSPAVPSETPEKAGETMFDVFLSPIRKAAEKRRAAERSEVDPELARLGINWLLAVCGIDHEPPMVEKIVICSNSLFVIRNDGRIDTITFTHDTRFPEQEIEEGILGKENSARRSDAIWLRRKTNRDGVRVLREGYQNATGLPIDFIVVIQNDTAIKDLVDKAFGKIKVNVPVGFIAHPVYLDEKTKLPKREYRPGTQEMDGTTVLQYIKAVPVANSYPPELENNERKHVVFRALFEALEQQKLNLLFWPPFLFNLNNFIQDQIKSGNVTSDFDIKELVVDNLGSLGESTGRLVLSQKPFRLGVPALGNSRYYVDPNLAVYRHSPIQWGTADSGDAYAKRDIEELKAYNNYYVEVPRNGNALDPDLVNGYWKPVRLDVRNFLLGY